MKKIVLWLIFTVFVSCRQPGDALNYSPNEDNVPYSKAVVNNGIIYTSGQLGIAPDTKRLQPDLGSQTKQIMDNLKALMETNNSDLQHLIKVNIYIKDIAQLKQVNEIYTSYLSGKKPARTSVQVDSLPQNALIEIDCIALAR